LHETLSHDGENLWKFVLKLHNELQSDNKDKHICMHTHTQADT